MQEETLRQISDENGASHDDTADGDVDVDKSDEHGTADEYMNDDGFAEDKCEIGGDVKQIPASHHFGRTGSAQASIGTTSITQ